MGSGKKEGKEGEEEEEVVTYVPVVGEGEPELRPTGQVELTKRKVDHSQMATDDYIYDRYRKKVRHY